MKKIVAIILSLLLGLLLICCNKKDIPADTTELNTDISTDEPEKSETDSPKESKESPKEITQFIKDYKIDIPNKRISYIEYSRPICVDNDNPDTPYIDFYNKPGENFIFRSQEKIDEIISFFEGITLEEGMGPPLSSKNSEYYNIYFEDGTKVWFMIWRHTFIVKCSDDSGEIEYLTYKIPNHNEFHEKSKTVLCK